MGHIVVSAKAIVAYLPISTGSWWVYKYSSRGGDIDTMTVRVLSKITSQSGDSLYMIQRRTTLFGIDTLYAFASKDSIVYYKDINRSYVSQKYLLPLATGAVWSDHVYQADTTKVLGIGQTVLNFVHYDSIYSIRRDASIPSKLIELTAIKPGIGIIEQSEYYYITYPDGYSIQLLTYHLEM